MYAVLSLLFCPQDVVTIQFNGKKLDKKDLFGKSDPFLVFYRCNEDNRLVTKPYSCFTSFAFKNSPPHCIGRMS